MERYILKYPKDWIKPQLNAECSPKSSISTHSNALNQNARHGQNVNKQNNLNQVHRWESTTAKPEESRQVGIIWKVVWDGLGKGAENQNGNLRWHLPWRGGGVSRRSRLPLSYFEKWFFKKPFRIIPWLWKRVLHLVWALYYVYIVVEVTLNMAK